MERYRQTRYGSIRRWPRAARNYCEIAEQNDRRRRYNRLAILRFSALRSVFMRRTRIGMRDACAVAGGISGNAKLMTVAAGK